MSPLSDWRHRSDFEGSARNAAASFVIGNVAYLGTGTNSDNERLQDFWAYDPARNTWTKVASYGGAKRIGAISFVINDLAYVGTGNNNGTPEKDWYAYDPKQDLWIEKNQFTSDQSTIARSYAVGFVINGKGYLTIGDGNTTVWQYDPGVDT